MYYSGSLRAGIVHIFEAEVKYAKIESYAR